MSELQSSGSSTSLGDHVSNAFYPLFNRLFNEDGDFVHSTRRSLRQARMSENVEMFMSRALGYGILSGLGLWLVGVIVGYLLFGTGLIDIGVIFGANIPNQQLLNILIALKIPTFILLTGLVLGSIGFVGAAGSFLLIPRLRASEREREIEKLLPDAVSFMYALSVGGLNQLEIIDSMAKAEDTYGEVSSEFQSITLETGYFDTDYRTAIYQQAQETPSRLFGQFLMDMLSILQSGGDMERFLEEKKDKHLRLAKQTQERRLETLELFGEMYMTLSLFPLLLIIILVAMSLLGDSKTTLLFGVVYGLLPLISIAFLVLVSTVKTDEIGTGELRLDADVDASVKTNPITDSGVVEGFQGRFHIFDRIREGEDTFNTIEILRNPHIFFRNNPMYTLAITVPSALVVLAVTITSGAVPTTLDGIKENPVWPTFMYIYVPLYMTFVPLSFFREWNVRWRYGILNNLSDTLRKLASANDTGQTLFESMNTVAESSRGRLATEFEIMYAKIQYGTTINQALIEFNNKYKIPRLARTIKLISKAQEASSQITDVLQTAAQASENQDDISRERKSQARMQVVIIMMTYLTLLFVMAILKTQFLEVMADLVSSTGGSSGGASASAGGSGGGQQFGGSINVSLLSMLFFHAVTIQAIFSGVISGYMRDAKLMSGLKYTVVLLTIALSVWLYVG